MTAVLVDSSLHSGYWMSQVWQTFTTSIKTTMLDSLLHSFQRVNKLYVIFIDRFCIKKSFCLVTVSLCIYELFSSDLLKRDTKPNVFKNNLVKSNIDSEIRLATILTNTYFFRRFYYCKTISKRNFLPMKY